jgi:hypothetical protein
MDEFVNMTDLKPGDFIRYFGSSPTSEFTLQLILEIKITKATFATGERSGLIVKWIALEVGGGILKRSWWPPTRVERIARGEM